MGCRRYSPDGFGNSDFGIRISDFGFIRSSSKSEIRIPKSHNPLPPTPVSLAPAPPRPRPARRATSNSRACTVQRARALVCQVEEGGAGYAFLVEAGAQGGVGMEAVEGIFSSSTESGL